MAENELLLPGSSPDAKRMSVEARQEELSLLLSQVKKMTLFDPSLTHVLEQIMEMYTYIRDEVTDQGNAKEELERMGYLLANHGFVDFVYYNVILASEKLENDPGRANLGVSRKLLCNLTDKSESLCKEIEDSRFMETMMKNLSDEKKENDTMSTTLQMLTLYNVLNKCPGSKHQFRKWGGVEVMMNFVQSESNPVKAAALLTVALAADLEADPSQSEHLIGSTESNINYMLWLVDECLKLPGHRTGLIDNYFRFRLDSLLSGLVCLSRNRSNALAIGRNGGLDRFQRILRSENSSLLEIQYTAETIWNLSFQDDNKIILTKNSNLMELVQKLKENKETSIKIAALGICLELFGRVNKERDLVPKHVMISYNWNDKELATKLMKKLQSEGVDVWMDIVEGNMDGDILEKMAHAIENSHAVIVCLSEAYRDSASCRMEATYACKVKKDIIPVRLEEDFEPSGWLGIVVGMKYKYDLTKEFDAQFDKLLTYLRKIISDDQEKYPAASKAKSSGSRQKQGSEDWTCEQVAAWWRDTAHIRCAPVDWLDGRLLAELKRWRKETPEFFLAFSQQKLQLTHPRDLVEFSAAINNL